MWVSESWVESTDPFGVTWSVFVLPGNQRLQSHASSSYHPLFVAIWNIRWKFMRDSQRTWQVLVFRSRRLTNMWMTDAVVREYFSTKEAAIQRQEYWCKAITSGDAIAPSPPGKFRTSTVFTTATEPDVVVPEQTPAGWRQDPEDRSQYRYWDGREWANHWSPR